MRIARATPASSSAFRARLTARWSELAKHPRDVTMFGRDAMRAPTPTGILRVEAVLVFERVRVPVTIGALPRVDGGSLGFTMGVRARLDFDSDVTVQTLGNVGTAEVDPLVYGVALGYQF